MPKNNKNINRDEVDEAKLKLKDAVNKRNVSLVKKRKEEDYGEEDEDSENSIYLSENEDSQEEYSEEEEEEEEVKCKPVKRKPNREKFASKRKPVQKKSKSNLRSDVVKRKIEEDEEGSDGYEPENSQVNRGNEESSQAFQTDLIEQLKLMGQKIEEFEKEKQEKQKKKPQKEIEKAERQAILNELIQDYERRNGHRKNLDKIINKKLGNIVDGCKF